MDSLSNKGDWMDERWWKVVEWMKMGEVERKWEKKYIARRLTCSGEIKDRIESFLKYFWRPRKPKLTIQVRLQQLMYSQFHLLRWHDNSLNESFGKMKTTTFVDFAEQWWYVVGWGWDGIYFGYGVTTALKIVQRSTPFLTRHFASRLGGFTPMNNLPHS